MKFKHAALLVLVFALLELTAMAQPTGGVIDGRVIMEDGLPASRAVVNIFGVSGALNQTSLMRETLTDEDGNFRMDGLEPIPYWVLAWTPGYVPDSNGETPWVHVGESVTLRLIRGGVITGRVTNDAGDPIVGVPVKATRVKDESGRPTNHVVSYSHLWTRTTDDRGIYRIYGLAPGSYTVAAGGSDRASSRSTPFAGRTTTYHPSSTRDAATLVNISRGSETTGIDIRYRGERGFAINGKILGAPGTNSVTTTFLRNPTNDETIEITTSDNQSGYAFYGVPNGEYEVIARNEELAGGNGLASTPRRVVIKGADLTGIDLTVLPNATISGVVDVVNDSKCKDPRKSYPEEIIVRARRDDLAERGGKLLPYVLGYGVGIPYDKGVFTIRDLAAGRHHIELELPDQTWYLKAMTMSGSNSGSDPRAGVAVRSGDKVVGLRLAVASGAALLKGKITVIENTRRLRVHLIPAEAEAKDDVLRFAETEVDADGVFTFTNLAPGKYLVLARTVPEKLLRPAAWDPVERQKLRKEAEAANLAIELKPCQQITDYALRL